MVKAIRVHELGGPEVLKWEDVEIGEPKEGEIRVKNKAIGLNFIDVYFRKGVYKAPQCPLLQVCLHICMEAAGVVTAVGSGLTGRKVGDVVAYAGNPMGSYAEEQILPAEKVVTVPPSLDPIVAASVILKGMTAHMLVRRCFKVEPGHTVLVHAAAGGVGSLLCQWANALGATVIGTVSTTEKAAQAKEDGCHHVIMYKEEDFVTRVNEITSGKGVDVVYDSVGKDTFQGSLACLKSRGYMVSYGQSSGMPDPLPMTELAAKSLFLTRASVLSYTATRDELLQAAGEVFSNVASGILRVRINHKYPLSQVAQAHEDLEGRKTSGSVVLIPDGVFEQSTIKATARAISASAPEAATMIKAIRVHELGGPEVLKWEDVEIGEPKEGEIRVKNKAIGLNFVDVYFRKGVYKASTMPFTPGREAAGVVTAVGPGLTGRKVGDVVAYAGNPMGSYAEEQILPAEKVVTVPPSLDPIVAASVILKGMTVHMLVRQCFKVEPGHTVLVHAAAGGVGSLLCQWANALGATVIGTVSTTEKAAQAKEDGCHHVIMYKEEDFVTRVNEITSGKGVDVVYDSVGKDTFQSSGMPDPLPMTELAAKSLFLTRASLFSYTATRDELLQAAGEVFSNVASGILRVRINHKYPLSQVAQAHEDLEGRKTSGSVVLIPDGVFEQ
ncbi:hypothetical protein RHGRI_008307 [Rhododendron griersonianum]|nr:hypothetical protein RHGRI_008307 [Rhododendron griersonianum]